MDCCHVSTFGFGFVCNIHCRKTYRCGGKLTSDSCCIGGFTVPMWFTDTVLTCVYAKPKKRLGKHNVAAHFFFLYYFLYLYMCVYTTLEIIETHWIAIAIFTLVIVCIRLWCKFNNVVSHFRALHTFAIHVAHIFSNSNYFHTHTMWGFSDRLAYSILYSCATSPPLYMMHHIVFNWCNNLSCFVY